MMDYELEVDDRGLYQLCVMGAYEKADEEVKELFIEFGQLERFHRSKGNLIFIGFSNEEAALACMRAFPGAPSTNIKVKPANSKKRSSDQPMKQNPNSMNRNLQGFQEKNFGGGDGFQQRSFSKDENTQKRFGGGDSVVSNQGPSKPVRVLVPKYVEAESAVPTPPVLKVVTIGNLHKYMTQAVLYDMCEKAKADPQHIVIKSFQRPRYRKMFYALVYVKTDEEVTNICQGLHGLVWNSQKLIVHTLTAAKKKGTELLQGKK